MKKRITTLLCTALLGISFVSAAHSANNDLKIVIEDRIVGDLDRVTMISNGEVFMPMNFFAGTLGGTVTKSKTDNTYFVERRNIKSMIVDGKIIYFPERPFYQDGKTYLPVGVFYGRILPSISINISENNDVFTITYKNKKVVIDKEKAVVSDGVSEQKIFPVGYLYKAERTYVPLEDVLTMLGIPHAVKENVLYL